MLSTSVPPNKYSTTVLHNDNNDMQDYKYTNDTNSTVNLNQCILSICFFFKRAHSFSDASTSVLAGTSAHTSLQLTAFEGPALQG